MVYGGSVLRCNASVGREFRSDSRSVILLTLTFIDKPEYKNLNSFFVVHAKSEILRNWKDLSETIAHLQMQKHMEHMKYIRTYVKKYKISTAECFLQFLNFPS